MTEGVIRDLQASKERAAIIVEAANKRRVALLGYTHIAAKNHIQGIKKSNADSLKDLQVMLEKENKGKEDEFKIATAEEIVELEKKGELLIDELADLLYNTIVSVEE